MQEGAFSLMQLPRTTVGIKKVKDAGLPYISCLCDPCYGGPSASYAMLGDIHIAEPGANIGFAGKRVIEQTIRETLPEKFQEAIKLIEAGKPADKILSSHLKDIIKTGKNVKAPGRVKALQYLVSLGIGTGFAGAIGFSPSDKLDVTS